MHTYASGGTYTVTLTVTDDDGATDSAVTTADIVVDSADAVADVVDDPAEIRAANPTALITIDS